MKNSLTYAELLNVLSYDPETGLFVWRRQPRYRPMRIGDVAGTVTDRGYIKIKISGVSYFAHRLAWLYQTGAWPADEIDHINHQRDDNRFANLRILSHRANQSNRRNNRKLVWGDRALTIAQWSAETGLNPATIRSRIERGWDVAVTLSRAA